MDRRLARSALLIAAFVVAVAGFSAMIARQGWVQALHQAADRGAADLMLATDRLQGQLHQFRQVAVVTADHPGVADMLRQGTTAEARLMLQRLADKSGALEVAVLRTDGAVLALASGRLQDGLAASAWLQPALQTARHGALGVAHRAGGVPSVTGDGAGRVWAFAAPVFRPDVAGAGRVAGVVLVLADIARVEAEWRGARPPIWFADASGRVILSNRSELLGWRQDGAMLRPPAGLAQARTRVVAGQVLWHSDWSPYIPRDAIHLAQDLPVLGLRAGVLIETASVLRLALLQGATVAAICLAFGAVLFLVLERRRAVMALNAALEVRVADRTAALTRAQADLVQAGKLSALGQMSAGISHELNQPLMAIQQFAENARAYLDRGQPQVADDNLRRITDLARRMGRIIKALRAFARQDSEPAARVDLVAVVEAALDLAASRLQDAGVSVDWQRPVGPVWVQGGEVRLGQVVVNLLTNASEAMVASPVRHVTVTLMDQGGTVVLEVADTGPGIREPDRIFDPFYTTRAVGAGEGMGLGLSISYGLVQSFGGAIRGRNRAGGGAVMTVELQGCAAPDQVAA